MAVFSDSVFKIGQKHKICEDYARNGCIGNWTYSILSDGCSGGEHSDFASRILVQSAIKELSEIKEIQNPEFFFESICLRSEFSIKALGLTKKSLLGTLMIIVSSEEDDDFHIFIAGDGFIAISYDNEVITAESRYSKSTPYYPIYGNSSHFEEKSKEKEQEFSFLWNRENSSINTIQHGYITHIIIPKEKADWAFVASDGIGTFISNDNKTSDFNGIECKIDTFTKIKQRQGSFLTRRVESALKRELKDFSFQDDISFAGLSFVRGIS